MDHEYFKLKVAKGSEIIGANFRLKLDAIPENVLEFWKKGAKEFEIKKGGLTLLESISYADLKDILAVRVLVGFRTEISLLKKLLKSKFDEANTVNTFRNSK